MNNLCICNYLHLTTYYFKKSRAYFKVSQSNSTLKQLSSCVLLAPYAYSSSLHSQKRLYYPPACSTSHPAFLVGLAQVFAQPSGELDKEIDLN